MACSPQLECWPLKPELYHLSPNYIFHIPEVVMGWRDILSYCMTLQTVSTFVEKGLCTQILWYKFTSGLLQCWGSCMTVMDPVGLPAKSEMIEFCCTNVIHFMLTLSYAAFVCMSLLWKIFLSLQLHSLCGSTGTPQTGQQMVAHLVTMTTFNKYSGKECKQTNQYLCIKLEELREVISSFHPVHIFVYAVTLWEIFFSLSASPKGNYRKLLENLT